MSCRHVYQTHHPVSRQKDRLVWRRRTTDPLGVLANARMPPPSPKQGATGQLVWLLLFARRGTAVTDCGRGPLAYAPPASGSEFAPSGALMGCARSERPRRSACAASDETRVPDERDPLEASVRRGWRESSKRSSASVGADAPFRGNPLVRSVRVWRLLLDQGGSRRRLLLPQRRTPSPSVAAHMLVDVVEHYTALRPKVPSAPSPGLTSIASSTQLRSALPIATNSSPGADPSQHDDSPGL